MLLNHDDAAAAASQHFGIEINSRDIAALCDLGLMPSFGSSQLVRLAEVHRIAASVLIHQDSAALFTDFHRLFANNQTLRDGPISVPSQGGTLFLKLSGKVAISVSVEDIQPELLQILLSRIRRFGSEECQPTNTIRTFEIGSGVSVWSTSELNQEIYRDTWRQAISESAKSDEAEMLIRPRIYGTKHKLAPFIAAVCRSYSPDDSAVLDLMSGSGVVSARLSPYFFVFANDANSYARLLTEVKFLEIEAGSWSRIKSTFDGDYERNRDDLEKLLKDVIAREQKFLHADQTIELAEAYRLFCAEFPFQDSELMARANERQSNPLKQPFCLVTAYFSNAYFGVRQSIQVDSIRFAIDQIADEQLKKLLLSALLIVCTTSGSGPHFAQPPKLASATAIKEIIEHRARDVYAEFLIMAEILLSTKRYPKRFLGATTGDWRSAIPEFTKMTNEFNSRLIYVDPPYSKLQFSRYYHVLNTLVTYSYPGFSGQGRYPPRSLRFSSKFEYQPGPAEREFSDLFRSVSSQNIISVVSYSDTGFVAPEKIVALMEQFFPIVHVYSKAFRHNSQGKRFKPGRQNVAEYLFVGTFD